jgi:hypothetical protein
LLLYTSRHTYRLSELRRRVRNHDLGPVFPTRLACQTLGKGSAHQFCSIQSAQTSFEYNDQSKTFHPKILGFARKEHISYSLSFRIERLKPKFASNSATVLLFPELRCPCRRVSGILVLVYSVSDPFALGAYPFVPHSTATSPYCSNSIPQ